jgi:hypothetical protein
MAQSVLVSSAHLPDHGRRYKTNTGRIIMRAQLAAFTIIATAIASPAWAQATAPASVFMSDKDIMALVTRPRPIARAMRR